MISREYYRYMDDAYCGEYIVSSLVVILFLRRRILERD